MKKVALVNFSLVMALLFGLSLAYAQQQSGDSQQAWQCPGMGQGRMMRHHGPGHMAMGPGGAAMGNPQLCPAAMIQQNEGKPLNADQAKQLLDGYLSRQNNPNLKLGEVKESGDVFEAAITTKDGSLVEKIQVDKKTGWFRRAS